MAYRREVRPGQVAGSQLFAAVADHSEKRVAHLRNAFEFSGNDPDDCGFGRPLFEPSSALPQRFIRPVTAGKIAHHAGKTPEYLVFVSERHGKRICPESCPVFPLMPALVSQAAFGGSPFQFDVELQAGIALVARIDARRMLTDDLFSPVTVNPLGTRVPFHNPSVRSQHEERIIFHP